jgi:hypothetical protein
MSGPATVRSLASTAEEALRRYTDPAGRFAWHTYDRLGDPDVLQPPDCLAPALLDAPLKRATVVAMFGSGDSPEAALLTELQAVLDHPKSKDARFEELDLDDESNPWGAVRRALRASDTTPGVKATKVTKILHRKRSDLVPIFDSRVAAFYGRSRSRPWELWPVLQADVGDNADWLDSLRNDYRTFDDRPMSRLRALDIIVWMHRPVQ